MSLLQGLNVRQKVAAAGLSLVALVGIAATGSSYLEKTKTKPARGGSHNLSKSSDVDSADANTGSKSASNGSSFRPAFGSVNINTATEQELDSLPGIGPATAAKIVEYRSANNGFSSIDELDQVKGIGPKKLEEMRPYCRL